MMKTCRDCKGEISRSAKSCPHCGAQKPNQSKFEYGLHQVANGLIGIGLIGTLLLAFVYCA